MWMIDFVRGCGPGVCRVGRLRRIEFLGLGVDELFSELE